MKAGAEYFRYADDQMILLQTKTGIDTLMLLLTRKLDRYGLKVNQKKVLFWTAKKLEENRCRKIHGIFSNKGDGRDPKLVRKFAAAYLAMPLNKLEKTWNSGAPLLNRLLFANLESLSHARLLALVGRYLQDDYLMRADHHKLARIYVLNGKCGSPVNLKKRLRRLGRTSVHNAFHIEALAFSEGIKDQRLALYFKNRLKTIERQMTDDDLG